MTEIHNKRGQVTAYGLSQGYVQSDVVGEKTLILRDVDGTYHIQIHEGDEPVRLVTIYATLKVARRRYSQELRKLHHPEG